MKRLLNFLLSLVNKPVKKLTLEDFLLKVWEIAIADGKDYYHANVKLTEHISNETKSKEIQFTCYVDGYSHYSDNTMEGSLQKLVDSMNKYKKTQIIQKVILP